MRTPFPQPCKSFIAAPGTCWCWIVKSTNTCPVRVSQPQLLLIATAAEYYYSCTNGQDRNEHLENCLLESKHG